jgi:uncharacterized protein (TIGR02186 family)
MSALVRTLILAGAILVAAPVQALALQTEEEPPVARIAAALTEDVVEIRSDFDGAELVIFGAAEGLEASDAIVVAVRGPQRDLRVMKKRRVLGIWVNAAPIRFEGAPTYFAVASSAPLQDIASFGALRRNQLGADHVRLSAPDLERTETLLGVTGVTVSELGPEIVDYREAVVRARSRQGLFLENPNGVERLEGGLFIARLALPSGAPTGDYDVDVYLFRDGGPIASRRTQLTVAKAGIERAVFDLAHGHPLAYGLLAVIMAALAGWAAAAVGGRR